MSQDLPTWARRIRSMREAKGWAQQEAVEQMRRHSDQALPDETHLLRRWKAWELGEKQAWKLLRVAHRCHARHGHSIAVPAT